ncbi:MAG: hypothetical protein J0I30_11030 [Burkholderiales bacterium]|nr:hypothetical protein [Burkholderiales bacterium]
MFWTIKVVIGDGERGLVYRNRRFQQILLPGVHRLSPFGGRPHVDIHTASKGAAYTGSDQDSLIEALGPRLDTHFVLANVGAGEVGRVARQEGFGRVAGDAHPGGQGTGLQRPGALRPFLAGPDRQDQAQDRDGHEFQQQGTPLGARRRPRPRLASSRRARRAPGRAIN